MYSMNSTNQVRGSIVTEESPEGNCVEDIDLSTYGFPRPQPIRVIPQDIDVHAQEHLSFELTVRLRECSLQRGSQIQEMAVTNPNGPYRLTTSPCPLTMPQNS